MRKLKAVMNPELTTGTDDMSSGASNRSKTTMCTDVQTNSASTTGTVNIEYEEPGATKRKREKKAEQKPLDVIEIRDSSSSQRESKGRRSDERKRMRLH
jgi:hypothetical protein